MKVFNPHNPNKTITINVADFDEEKHVRFDRTGLPVFSEQEAELMRTAANRFNELQASGRVASRSESNSNADELSRLKAQLAEAQKLNEDQAQKIEAARLAAEKAPKTKPAAAKSDNKPATEDGDGEGLAGLAGAPAAKPTK